MVISKKFSGTSKKGEKGVGIRYYLRASFVFCVFFFPFLLSKFWQILTPKQRSKFVKFTLGQKKIPKKIFNFFVENSEILPGKKSFGGWGGGGWSRFFFVFFFFLVLACYLYIARK